MPEVQDGRCRDSTEVQTRILSSQLLSLFQSQVGDDPFSLSLRNILVSPTCLEDVNFLANIRNGNQSEQRY